MLPSMLQQAAAKRLIPGPTSSDKQVTGSQLTISGPPELQTAAEPIDAADKHMSGGASIKPSRAESMAVVCAHQAMNLAVSRLMNGLQHHAARMSCC
jgi:hypothetical protein